MKNFYKDKKVLITGHTGFKGAWLSKILFNWGAQVVGVSLPPHTSPSLFDALNLQDKIYKNYFSDIRDFKKIKEIIETEKPEIIYHLAAQAIVRDSYDDPLGTYYSNTLGTANIMQAVKETDCVKSLIIITTDKVYENKEWLYPYREMDSLGGHDPYSASKAAADIITNSYIKSFFNPNNFGEKHNTLVSIVRAGNVIGGGDWAKDRLIPDMIRGIFEKNETIIIRSPKSIRPWQHVFEPLRGYLMLGKEMYEGNKQLSGPWNFGPTEESFICVEELVKNAIFILNKGDYKIIEDPSKHEAILLKLDINKARNILNWHPKWMLEDSLKATFEWYNKFYEEKSLINNFTDEQIKLYFDN